MNIMEKGQLLLIANLRECNEDVETYHLKAPLVSVEAVHLDVS